MNNTQKSLAAILICYFSWGLFPIYFKLLKSIGAYEVLAMRILCSFIFMILVVGVAKNKKTIFEEIKKIWGNKKSFLLLVLASFLITGNWLTYIIAVNTNHVLEASFGYYLNPIVTIILAVVFLNYCLPFCWGFTIISIHLFRISTLDFYYACIYIRTL